MIGSVRYQRLQVHIDARDTAPVYRKMEVVQVVLEHNHR